MKKLLVLTILLASCSDIQQVDLYKEGDQVMLTDGRTAVIDKVIPSGYIVFIANKFEVKFFSISNQDIKK